MVQSITHSSCDKQASYRHSTSPHFWERSTVTTIVLYLDNIPKNSFDYLPTHGVMAEKVDAAVDS